MVKLFCNIFFIFNIIPIPKHSQAQQGRAKHSKAQSTARHSKAQSTARHSKAEPSTAKHKAKPSTARQSQTEPS